jgi:hypothetical protein
MSTLPNRQLRSGGRRTSGQSPERGGETAMDEMMPEAFAFAGGSEFSADYVQQLRLA